MHTHTHMHVLMYILGSLLTSDALNQITLSSVGDLLLTLNNTQLSESCLQHVHADFAAPTLTLMCIKTMTGSEFSPAVIHQAV